MDLVDYEPAVESGLAKAQVFSLAESIAKQLDFDPCSNIYDAVSQLGGSVEVENTLFQDPAKSGSLFVTAPGKFKIVIPEHTSPLRDRFTIAHELGHYVLHYLWRRRSNPGLVRMRALRKDSQRVEWEANWFAAAFLMPEQLFRQRHEEVNGNIEDLAERFCVSKSAIETRIKNLNL